MALIRGKPYLLIICWLVPLGLGAQGLDILNEPADASSTGLRLTRDPLLVAHDPLEPPQADFSAWQWTGDISGANITLTNHDWVMGIRSILVPGIEVRGDEPSQDPLSIYSWSTLLLGVGKQTVWKQISILATVNLLREQGLDDVQRHVALNLAFQRNVGNQNLVSAGLRHLPLRNGGTLPTELWGRIQREFEAFGALAELNTGPRPLAMGLSWRGGPSLQIHGGVQVESLDAAGLRFHPGVAADIHWQNFGFGLGLGDWSHPLGARRTLTVTWQY